MQNYPNHAPAGLKENITGWAEVGTKRFTNLWDIRRFDDGDHWTIPKLDDVGNWDATPGIALAASWVDYGAVWCLSLAYSEFDSHAKKVPSLMQIRVMRWWVVVLVVLPIAASNYVNKLLWVNALFGHGTGWRMAFLLTDIARLLTDPVRYFYQF